MENPTQAAVWPTAPVTRRSQPSRWFAIGAGVASALVLAAAATVGWLGADRAMHPPRQHDLARLWQYPFAPATRTLRFRSRDGTALVGWWIPASIPPRGTIVLLHGYGQSRVALLHHIAYLFTAGYHILAFDFRGCGDSDGMVTFGIKEPLDVLSAVDLAVQLSGEDGTCPAIQGVSLGASAGLIAMAQDQRIRAAVIESPFTDLEAMISRNFQAYIHLPAIPFATALVSLMNRRAGGSVAGVVPLKAAGRLGDRPLLLIEDECDEINPPNSGEEVFAAASGPKELWVVPKAQHAMGYNANPVEYAHHVIRFYTARFGNHALEGGSSTSEDVLSRHSTAGRQEHSA